MIGRIRHILNSTRSKNNVDEDFYTNVNLSGERKMLPPSEINHVVDVGERFDKERRESNLYRFTFTISPLFSNPLCNITGNVNLGDFGTSNITENGNGYITLNSDIFLKDPTDNDFVGRDDYTFKESIINNLKEKDGWFGFYDPDVTKNNVCGFFDLEPSRKQFSLNSNIKKNWEILLTYPHATDNTHNTVNGGLLLVAAEVVEVGGREMVALATSTFHGLSNGDKVRLTNMPVTNFNGDFTVIRLGLDNGDLKDNYFVIDIDPNTVPVSAAFSTGRMKRVVNGQESTYYLRKFKKLMLNDNDYDIYPLAFSKNIFNDENYQVVINQDIDLTDLTDNLGRPLSEIYLTFLKTSSGNMFTPVKSGLDLEFLQGNLNEEVSNARRIHNGINDPNYFTSQVPLESNLTVNNGEFYGDVVEYNSFELRETVLAEVMHIFNTNDRESTYSGVASGPRRESYLYNPHHRVKIKEFSLYIEQGDDNTVGIPDYATDLGDGRIIWRDLLDVGIYDGEGDFLDYPFTNGCHYIHQNVCFMTKRQDPYGAYGLYYYGNQSDDENYDPNDPIGNAITDNFVVKKSGNVC